MVLAVGATAVHPRLAIELAAELAGTRGAETLTPADTIARLASRLRGRPAQDAGPDGHQRRRLVHRRRAHRRRRPRRVGRRALLPDRGRLARPDDAAPTSAERQLRRRDGRRWPSPSPPPVASRACPTPASRASAPTARRTCSRRDRRRDQGPRGAHANGAPLDIDAALARYRTALARPTTRSLRPARRASRPARPRRRRRSTRSRTRGRSSAASSCRR